MKTCIIVDDEPLAIDLLSDHIQKVEDLKLVHTFLNPIEALQYINKNKVDLLFLDVQMPELSGIQLLKILDQEQKVILTTAYEQYALDGFDHEVLDFLLKPISFERFQKSIQKVQKQSSKVPVSTNVSGSQDFMFVKSEYKFVKIFYKDILYLEGLGDYVSIHLKDSKILTLKNLKAFVEELPAAEFKRVHKSYIISLSKINFVERNRVMISDKRIPVGSTYQSDFWDYIHGD